MIKQIEFLTRPAYKRLPFRKQILFIPWEVLKVELKSGVALRRKGSLSAANMN